MPGPRHHLPTHEVENQPEPIADVNLFASDPILMASVPDRLSDYGAALGLSETRGMGRAANVHVPELNLFDTGGRRLDEVVFHPAYHDMMTLSQEAGYAATAWDGGSHVEHAAMVYMASQIEPGHCCPLTMTYAAVPAFQVSADLARDWVPKLTARSYDPRILPIHQKSSATLGMAMTEKQGGSDVRANTTCAVRDGDHWRLTGHKWFCSAPMSDGFLTLAQTRDGLTCFLVPRWLDGDRNAIHLMRLKDKLGNKANASSEIEYHDALAYQLGDEGRGVQTIIEMVHHTRLDTAMAPAGLMRGALSHAMHWVQHRRVFQKTLIDQPLMRSVLADLILDWQAATRLGLHVATAFDDPDARPLARISVALAKFLNNKLCPRVTLEAMEALGGMGYVEDTPMPMYYREAPLNSIWEGSGNVICLDILRTLAREPEAGAALNADLDAARGSDPRYDQALDAHRARWPTLAPEAEARAFAERTALLLAGSVLIRTAPAAVAEGFVGTRLHQPSGQIAGSASGLDTRAILDSFTT
ncbi:acyl-CoA dehydrogenase family protein [Tateyamaria omphalii]|uniref:acyl-CoA dehydrogenase family protein n=1 Tax=Tateyamaria omphalii TaxID=299262 RepID=UPI001C997238|nr:acyl-CoA dehydrogenase family protein [Tateyamaria omphalii]MBY5934609.1 acyl-CoA dehydrogenase family protein [Tateyamaria omphalii]